MGNADLVFQSYGRSCNNPIFFEDFYASFMGKSQEIRNMFIDTDMSAQEGLLRGGILWLVMHARGMSDAKIRALGESHSRRHMNIHPSHYTLWLDALMETLHKHDPEFDNDLEETWRVTIKPGIDLIKSMYED
ncbi:globin [Pseudomonas sp. HK3]|jgi:hemoglobin-like flavoprotein